MKIQLIILALAYILLIAGGEVPAMQVLVSILLVSVIIRIGQDSETKWTNDIVSGFVLLGAIGQASFRHSGLLLFFWMVAGGALTLMVRLEGGETASKPGRILQMQQHGSTFLLLCLTVLVVAGTGNWNLNGPGHTDDQSTILGLERLFSAAGIRGGRQAGEMTLLLSVPALLVLRLGLFPLPFSLRRTARRLRGRSLLLFVGFFLPSSLIAVSRFYSHIGIVGGSRLAVVTAGLGLISLISGALWLQAEWKTGALIGHLAQVYLGLGLIGLAIGGPSVLRPHLLQTALVLTAAVIWESKIRSELGESDLSKCGDGYLGDPLFTKLHLGVILLSVPWPGTPSGRIWMLVLGRDMLSGSGLGLLTLAGVILTSAGMARSLGKILGRSLEASGVGNLTWAED